MIDLITYTAYLNWAEQWETNRYLVENKLYKKLKEFAVLFKRQYCFFYYKRHRIYLGRGFKWEDLKDNLMLDSLGLSTITFYLTNIPSQEMNMQWDYRNLRIPSKDTYYLPFNWLSTGVIFSDSCGVTRTNKEVAAQIFSIGDKIVSTVNEILEPDAFTNVCTTYVEADGGNIFPPKFDTTTNLFPVTQPPDFVCINEQNIYDLVFLYPNFDKKPTTTEPLYVALQTKGDYYGRWRTLSVLKEEKKFFAVELPRPHLGFQNFVKSVLIKDSQGNDIKGTFKNILLGQSAIIGNSPLVTYQQQNSIFNAFKKIKKSELLQGQFTPTGLYEYQFSPNPNSQEWWVFITRPLFNTTHELETYTQDYGYQDLFNNYNFLPQPQQWASCFAGGSWVVQSGVPYEWGDFLALQFTNPELWSSDFALIPNSDYYYFAYLGKRTGANHTKEQCAKDYLQGMANYEMVVNAPMAFEKNNYVILKNINFSNGIASIPNIGYQDTFPDDYPFQMEQYNSSISSDLNAFQTNTLKAARQQTVDATPMKIGMRTFPNMVNQDEINSFIFECTAGIVFILNADSSSWTQEGDWYRYKDSFTIPNSYAQIPFKNYTTALFKGFDNSTSANLVCLKTDLGSKYRNFVVPTNISTRNQNFCFVNNINSLIKFNIWIKELIDTTSFISVVIYLN